MEMPKAFLRTLLHPDPSFRPSAREALLHPWLLDTVAGGGDIESYEAEAVVDNEVAGSRWLRHTADALRYRHAGHHRNALFTGLSKQVRVV